MFFSSKPKTESPDALPAGGAAPAVAGGMDSESVKKAIIQQVLLESNTSNARQLMDNMNERCFESCVPTPGTSTSSGEQTCINQCMEKYISAWNVVNLTYRRRLQQEIGGSS